MKVLIMSDTHGRNHNILNTIKQVKPMDLLIHLGDLGGGEGYIEEIAECQTEMVSGNNDFYGGLPKDKLINIGKYRVLLTHGHRYGVNYDVNNLLVAGEKNKADIVMFGHTHVPMIDLSHDIWLINPGSLALPRQYGRVPTFIIMEIDSKGEAHFALNYYKEEEENS